MLQGGRNERELVTPAGLGSAVEGLPGGLLRPGYRHSAALDCRRQSYSAGGLGFLLGLRRLSPPSRNISEFSTRSAMAVLSLDPLKRASAALTLGGVFKIPAIEVLTRLLRDEHPVVGAAATQALATVDFRGDRKAFRPAGLMPIRPMKDNGMVTG